MRHEGPPGGTPIVARLRGSPNLSDRPTGPNLGCMEPRIYAMIFYATVEQEILPQLEAIGLDARRAWARRPR